MGIFSSRFAINCFKTSPSNNNVGDVIEPWMYPEVTHLVRAAIKRRYELIPYIYSLALESHMTASPPQRWTGWGYENDAEVWTNKTLTDGETQYWLGDALLVGGVYVAGESSARMYLPRQDEHDPGYVNVNSPYEHHEAGQWVDIDAQWDKNVPLLAKVGSAIPIGKDVQTAAVGDRENVANLPADDFRGVEIFPQQDDFGRSFSTTWYEDDGISPSSDISAFKVSYKASQEEVEVSFAHESGAFKPLWKQLHIVLPHWDSRVVKDSHGKEVPQASSRSDRRVFVLDTQ